MKKKTSVLASMLLISQIVLAGTYSGGTGEPNNPYLIYDANQMNAIGADPCNWDKHFKLMADVDLSHFTGADFNIIGRRSIKPFAGVFDGAGHKIRNFSYASGETGYIGLFGQLDHSGEIKNLGLENAHIDAGDRWEIGALVGINYGGTITNCYTTGSLSAGGAAGGLVGSNRGTISTCYSTVSVTGQVWDFGGLAGYNRGSITHCYATGAVEGDKRTGGLVGFNYTEGTITHCYAAGAVTGQHEVGGLVGCGSYKVSSCFWDIDTSGQSRSAGGKGMHTHELQMARTFVGWNVCGQVIWTLDQGRGYPRLFWENKPGSPIPSELSAYIQGIGKPEDAFLIYTADEFNMIGLFPCDWNKHFMLKAHIDLTGLGNKEYNFIGYYNDENDNKPFTGVFDGTGHIISNFQYAYGYRTNYVALFGYVGGGEIKNLGLKDVAIELSEGACVAALVGSNEGTVSNCYATGSVWAEFAVGGLVSINYGKISCCFAKTSVTSGPSAGGLVAYNRGSISNCYATGQVMGSAKGGGLVCQNWGTIVNCYATGWVMPFGRYPGGLVGLNCCEDVIDSFWDTETSQMPFSDGGMGLPTDEMQTESTFTDAGWDFVEIWGIGENQTYPFLRQYPAGDINHDDKVNFLDVAIIADHWLEGAGE